MVIVIESRCLQFFCLWPGQHSQSDTGFQVQIFYHADHLDDFVEILIGRVTPGSAHAKTAGAVVFCIQCRLSDVFEWHQAFAFETGIVLRTLRAIGTIFGAGAGFNAQQ